MQKDSGERWGRGWASVGYVDWDLVSRSELMRQAVVGVFGLGVIGWGNPGARLGKCGMFAYNYIRIDVVLVERHSGLFRTISCFYRPLVIWKHLPQCSREGNTHPI